MSQGLAKSDFIGRAKRDKKVHLYCQPFGYPIRYCDWACPESDIVSDTEEEITCCRCLKKLELEQKYAKEVKEDAHRLS